MLIFLLKLAYVWVANNQMCDITYRSTGAACSDELMSQLCLCWSQCLRRQMANLRLCYNRLNHSPMAFKFIFLISLLCCIIGQQAGVAASSGPHRLLQGTALPSRNSYTIQPRRESALAARGWSANQGINAAMGSAKIRQSVSYGTATTTMNALRR